MTSTERDEAAVTWAETPRPSRREAALDAGYEPHESDRCEGPPLDETWQAAFDESVAEVKRREACDWCDPRRPLPAYTNGLCRDHWDEAHDMWDGEER